MVGELEVSVHVTDRDAGARALRVRNVIDQLVFGQIAAQEDLVADREDIRVPGPGNLDRGRQFLLVAPEIVIQPNADHRLQAIFGGDLRDPFMAVGAREGAHPPHRRRDDPEPLAYLILADLVSRALALEIGAEGNAVNPLPENFVYQGPERIHGVCGQVDSREGEPAHVGV